MFDCFCSSAGLLQGIRSVQRALVTQMQGAEPVYVVVVLGLRSRVLLCVPLDLKPVSRLLRLKSSRSFSVRRHIPSFAFSNSMHFLKFSSIFVTLIISSGFRLLGVRGRKRCAKCVCEELLWTFSTHTGYLLKILLQFLLLKKNWCFVLYFTCIGVLPVRMSVWGCHIS